MAARSLLRSHSACAPPATDAEGSAGGVDGPAADGAPHVELQEDVYGPFSGQVGPGVDPVRRGEGVGDVHPEVRAWPVRVVVA